MPAVVRRRSLTSLVCSVVVACASSEPVIHGAQRTDAHRTVVNLRAPVRSAPTSFLLAVSPDDEVDWGSSGEDTSEEDAPVRRRVSRRRRERDPLAWSEIRAPKGIQIIHEDVYAPVFVRDGDSEAYTSAVPLGLPTTITPEWRRHAVSDDDEPGEITTEDVTVAAPRRTARRHVVAQRDAPVSFMVALSVEEERDEPMPPAPVIPDVAPAMIEERVEAPAPRSRRPIAIVTEAAARAPSQEPFVTVATSRPGPTGRRHVASGTAPAEDEKTIGAGAVVNPAIPAPNFREIENELAASTAATSPEAKTGPESTTTPEAKTATERPAVHPAPEKHVGSPSRLLAVREPRPAAATDDEDEDDPPKKPAKKAKPSIDDDEEDVPRRPPPAGKPTPDPVSVWPPEPSTTATTEDVPPPKPSRAEPAHTRPTAPSEAAPREEAADEDGSDDEPAPTRASKRTQPPSRKERAREKERDDELMPDPPAPKKHESEPLAADALPTDLRPYDKPASTGPRDADWIGISITGGAGVLLASDSVSGFKPMLAYGGQLTIHPSTPGFLGFDLSVWRASRSDGTSFLHTETSYLHMSARLMFTRVLSRHLFGGIGGGLLLTRSAVRYTGGDDPAQAVDGTLMRPGADATLAFGARFGVLELRLDAHALVRGGLRLDLLPTGSLGLTF